MFNLQDKPGKHILNQGQSNCVRGVLSSRLVLLPCLFKPGNNMKKKSYARELKDRYHSYKDLIKFSEEMKLKPTPAEKFFRNKLDDYAELSYKIQEVIGYYIADFVFPTKMIILELDGSVHAKRKEYDKERDLFFKSIGFTVIRLSNLNCIDYDLNNIQYFPFIPMDNYEKIKEKWKNLKMATDKIAKREINERLKKPLSKRARYRKRLKERKNAERYRNS